MNTHQPSSDKISHKLSIEDFARSFGVSIEDIPPDCRELIDRTDFSYKILTGIERDRIILNVLKKIDSDDQIIALPERRLAWHKGWEENLRDFIKSGYDLKKLTPKFIRPNQVIRFNQDYILPTNPNFELDYLSVFRLWLFRKYLKDINNIYEFGCGTGFNLVILAQLYPDKQLYGLDFVNSSIELVNKIGEVYGWNMRGYPFDMISPDGNFQIKENSAVFTFGAVEQLAGKFEVFLQFLLKRTPAMCIHIEPTIELYDQENLIDFLAIKFHKKRGYTLNWLTRLKELEAEGKIEILKIKRSFFGSLYMEGYSLIIWRCIS